MKTKIEKKAAVLLDAAINEVFTALHIEFKTKSGDITPEQDSFLTYYKSQLEKLIIEQVKQNL